MSAVFHFTDSGRLPWMLSSGVIRPTLSKIGGFPPDFVWATSTSNGDKTSSSYGPYRAGMVNLVRIKLRSDDFVPWTGATLPPEWTAAHIRMLERAARRDGVSPATCWIRRDALSLDAVECIHFKSWSSKWLEFPADAQAAVEGDVAHVQVGTLVWVSKRGIGPQGSAAYSIMRAAA
jgi:hypothetical protein